MSDCDAGGTNPPPTEKRTGTVLVSLRASGAGEKIYHTDPEDCPAVGDMKTPAEKPRDVLTDEWTECRYCSGEFETGGVPKGTDPGATRAALLAADADDLRADGGEPLQATFADGALERQSTLDEQEAADDC